MAFITTKINDFYGIEESNNKPSQFSAEVIRNFDLRGDRSGLTVRNGYRKKYSAPSNARYTNTSTIAIENFYLSMGSGREVTLLIQKAVLNAPPNSNITPDQVGVVLFWIRPYWNGSNWRDEWYCLNDMWLTKIQNIDINGDEDVFEIYLQTNDNLKNYSILHYPYNQTSYKTINDSSSIVYSEDVGVGHKIFTRTGFNDWEVNDKLILTRNYIPMETLTNLYSVISTGDVSFQKVLNDVKIAFGGYENRLSVSIGYRKFNWLSGLESLPLAGQVSNEEWNKVDDVIIDPHNTISHDSTYSIEVSTPPSGGISFPRKRYFYKITVVLDELSEMEILNGDIVPTDNDNINFKIGMKWGLFNKRTTSVRLYLAEGEDSNSTDPESEYYFLKQWNISENSFSNKYSCTSFNGRLFVSADIGGDTFTNADFENATETLNEIAGYFTTTEMVQSWDKSLTINDRIYLLNPFIDKRYASKIILNELNPGGAIMYDVFANTYLDNQDFSGSEALTFIKHSNNEIGIVRRNSYRRINSETGVELSVMEQSFGSTSLRGVQSDGRNIYICANKDVFKISGFDLENLSEKTIRSKYRNIDSKELIFSCIEENESAFRFFDGGENDNEYIFIPNKGFITYWKDQIPKQYIKDTNGNIVFVSDNDIYHENSDYYFDGAFGNPIDFQYKSAPIDLPFLDSSLTYTDIFYVFAVWIKCSKAPIGTKFNVYCDDEVYSSFDISSISNKRFILPPGASCQKFQIEVIGSTTSDYTIEAMGIEWKPKKIGVFNALK